MGIRKSNELKFHECLDYADEVFLTRIEARIEYWRTVISMIEGLWEELRDGTISDHPDNAGRVANQELTRIMSEIDRKLEVVHDLLLIQDMFSKKMRCERSPDESVLTQNENGKESDPSIG